LYKDGRRRWIARWSGQPSKVFLQKADAAAYEAEMRRRAQLGAHAPATPSGNRLVEYLDAWWARESPTWANSTCSQRGQIIDKWITPYVSNVRLRDLGRERVKVWRQEILADAAPPTQANHALAVLSAALGKAVEDGLLPANPCSGVRKMRVLVRRPKALLPLEVERVRVEMPSLRDVCLLGLMAYAGLRPEEAFALTWQNVKDGLLIIDRSFTYGELKQTKTERMRVVEVVSALKDDLDLLRPHVTTEDDLVAPNERLGHIDLRNWRRRVWSPACRAADIKATPYDLRHTYVSLRFHEGATYPAVMAATGHSRATTTARYTHLYEEAQLASRTPMDEAILAARRDLEEQELHSSCTGETPRRLRQSAAGG
jgi:integrase